MTEKHRAKRKDNGEWVCGGSLLQTESGKYILPEAHTICTYSICYNLIKIDVEEGEFFAIDPATLSRCSGLTACGQDVYEGDIIRFDHAAEIAQWTAVLRFGWHENEYGWWLDAVRDTPISKQIGRWLGGDKTRVFGVVATVIGNVWDNPELMEGQT